MISVSVRVSEEVTVHITVRTSGTEPKIKFYSEIMDESVQNSQKEGKGEEGKKKEEVDGVLRKVVDEVMNAWLDPKKYGLNAKSSA